MFDYQTWCLQYFNAKILLPWLKSGQRSIDVFKLKHYGLRKQIIIKDQISSNHIIINSAKNGEGTGSHLFIKC